MVEDEDQIRDHEEKQGQTELVVFRQTHRRFDAVCVLVRRNQQRLLRNGCHPRPQVADSRKFILNDPQRVVGCGNAGGAFPRSLISVVD